LGEGRAIGLFDSGVGGLTVAEELFRQMPHEEIIYFGDTANVPYGGRPVSQLISFADRIINFLVQQGAKYIIFACNTSSSVSLGVMRERYPVSMMGLIEPGARAAVRATSNGRIGVLATEATIRSGAYARAIRQLSPEAEVLDMPAPKLVPLVEAGELASIRAEAALREYLDPLKRRGIDTLVLGCTHYPFLRDLICKILGPEIALVDPAAATVAAARNELDALGLLASPRVSAPNHRFYVSGDAASFARVAGLCLQRELLRVNELRLTG